MNQTSNQAGRPNDPKDEKGFSLFELLLVVTLILVLLAMAGASIFSLGSALSLTEAGDLVGDALVEARQLAVSTGNAVEVRIYDLSTADDDLMAAAVQIAQQRNDGNYLANNPILLPEGVGISREGRYTSFFESGGQTKMLLRGKAGMLLPGDQDAEFVGFRFLPNGSANLTDDKWFLTLHRTDELGVEVPKNFFTIQIDPLLGQIQIFRP